MDKVKELIERLERLACCEVEQDPKAIDFKGLGEITDAIKDCCEGLYYYECFLMSKKYREDEEKTREDERRYYRGQPRDSMGRYTSRGGRRGFQDRMIPMLDTDEWDMQQMRNMDYLTDRMYYPNDGGMDMTQNDSANRRRGYDGMSGTYSGGTRRTPSASSQGGRSGSSRYGYSHDEYMEKREHLSKEDPEDKKKRKELLDEHLEDMLGMGKELVEDMTPEEKQLWKQKITKLMTL